MWYLLHTSCTVSRRFFQVKCCLIVCSVLVSPGWHKWLWYHSTMRFWSVLGTHILFYLQMRRRVLPAPWKVRKVYLSGYLRAFSINLLSFCWFIISVLKLIGCSSSGTSPFSRPKLSANFVLLGLFGLISTWSLISNLLKTSALLYF